MWERVANVLHGIRRNTLKRLENERVLRCSHRKTFASKRLLEIVGRHRRQAPRGISVLYPGPRARRHRGPREDHQRAAEGANGQGHQARGQVGARLGPACISASQRGDSRQLKQSRRTREASSGLRSALLGRPLHNWGVGGLCRRADRVCPPSRHSPITSPRQMSSDFLCTALIEAARRTEGHARIFLG